MVQPVGSSIQPVTFVPIQPVARVGAALVEQTKQALAQLQQPLPLPQTQALTTAVAQAAGRQDGLAPLMADLGQAMETPDMAAPVRAAAAEVLRLQTPLGPDMAAPAVRQAVSQSGLFLEARLATAPDRPPGPDLKAALLVLRQVLVQATPAQAAPSAPSPASPPAASLGASPVPPAAQPAAPASVAASAALAAPAAPTAPGAPASATPTSTAPQPPLSQASASGAPAVQTSTPQTAASAPPVAAPPAAAPAALAGRAPAPAPLTAPGPGAVLTAPTAGAAAASEASPDQALAAGPVRGPATPAAASPAAAAPPEAALATLAAKTPALLPTQTAPLPPLAAPTAAASAAAGALAARDGLPPPYRGGPVRAQRAAAPTLPAGAAAPTVTASLLKQTDAALAREELLQAASMPEGPRRAEADREAIRSEPARWMLDIPLTTPQGPAVAQMEISRDGRAPGAAPTDEPVWRVRFSIDAEPLGPVHAAVVMQGGQAHVGLWAERPGSALDLRARMGELTTALSEAADTVEVAVYAGAPPQRAPEAGRLVDQSS